MLRRDDPTFNRLVDGVLAGPMKSGEFMKICTRWFPSPIPPKNINLNLPMDKAIADILKALSVKPAT